MDHLAASIDFECSLCYEPMDNKTIMFVTSSIHPDPPHNPITACGHSFCKECWEEVVVGTHKRKQQQNPHGAPEHPECPECRCLIKAVSTNRLAMEAMKDRAKVKNSIQENLNKIKEENLALIREKDEQLTKLNENTQALNDQLLKIQQEKEEAQQTQKRELERHREELERHKKELERQRLEQERAFQKQLEEMERQQRHLEEIREQKLREEYQKRKEEENAFDDSPLKPPPPSSSPTDLLRSWMPSIPLSSTFTAYFSSTGSLLKYLSGQSFRLFFFKKI
eukprot:TRINITY_DN1967_c0_g1_i4.p2 TRINITY_DN1967_c0_g1~~TRINITY_DN1967_c0_g1_i4.p2  ORF type:complete len:281 (-),score=99.22 TRINITY_DN1967_c0_g1_i4:1160-2002(-)